MTTPLSDADLIGEIRNLSREVGRLRAETEHLEKVTVPREEQQQSRRRFIRLALVSLVGLILAFGVFGRLLGELHQSQDQLAKTNYDACVARNKSAVVQGESVVKINHLLGTLRNTDRALLSAAAKRNPTVAKAERQRLAAYDDYLRFVADVTKAPTGPKPPPCESYLR